MEEGLPATKFDHCLVQPRNLRLLLFHYHVTLPRPPGQGILDLQHLRRIPPKNSFVPHLPQTSSLFKLQDPSVELNSCNISLVALKLPLSP